MVVGAVVLWKINDFVLPRTQYDVRYCGRGHAWQKPNYRLHCE